METGVRHWWVQLDLRTAGGHHLLCWSRSSSGTLKRNFLLLRVRTISFLLWSDVSGMVSSPSEERGRSQTGSFGATWEPRCGGYLMMRC